MIVMSIAVLDRQNTRGVPHSMTASVRLRPPVHQYTTMLFLPSCIRSTMLLFIRCIILCHLWDPETLVPREEKPSVSICGTVNIPVPVMVVVRCSSPEMIETKMTERIFDFPIL